MKNLSYENATMKFRPRTTFFHPLGTISKMIQNLKKNYGSVRKDVRKLIRSVMSPTVICILIYEEIFLSMMMKILYSIFFLFWKEGKRRRKKKVNHKKKLQGLHLAAAAKGTTHIESVFSYYLYYFVVNFACGVPSCDCYQ